LINSIPDALEIVFENNDIICINKKAGVPSQADLSGDISVFDKVKKYLQYEPFLLNRIDRPVSGIILFAKTKEMAKLYSKFLSDKATVKTYYAIVENKPVLLENTLENTLIKKAKKTYISKNPNIGKKAVLSYKYIGSGDRYHYLKIKLITGRFHQIRAQLAHIGCFIKGDVKYGAKRANKDRSICLHAYSIEIKTLNKKPLLTIKADFTDTILWRDLQRYM